MYREDYNVWFLGSMLARMIHDRGFCDTCCACTSRNPAVNGLMADEMGLVRELVREYSDIFALDSMELGTTELVTHSIDTSDSHPYISTTEKNSVCSPAYSRGNGSKMMAQGVIKELNSPGLAQ